MPDEPLEGRDPATVFETGDSVGELKKRLGEQLLNAQMDRRLGEGAAQEADKHRNGYGFKTGPTRQAELSIFRDRHGCFDLLLIGKYRVSALDDKIMTLHPHNDEPQSPGSSSKEPLRSSISYTLDHQRVATAVMSAKHVRTILGAGLARVSDENR